MWALNLDRDPALHKINVRKGQELSAIVICRHAFSAGICRPQEPGIHREIPAEWTGRVNDSDPETSIC